MIVTRAPFRISLGGGGTDLPSYYSAFGSQVLTVTIDKYLYICANTPKADDRIRVKYSDQEVVDDVASVKHDLVRAALGYLRIGAPIEIASLADIPAGTGMGSSGAYTVALLLALHELRGERLTEDELAEEACFLEMTLARHPSGKQDPYASSHGGFLAMKIACDGQTTTERLELATDVQRRLSRQLLLFFTGRTRPSAEILAEQREDTASGQPGVLASLHRTRQLALDIRGTLEAGSIDEFGALLHEHWLQKKTRSARISAPEIDQFYALARRHGVTGGKLIGAGGGGFLALCARIDRVNEVRTVMSDTGLRELEYDFDDAGATLLATS